jgi:hypothetical protein
MSKPPEPAPLPIKNELQESVILRITLGFSTPMQSLSLVSCVLTPSLQPSCLP